MSTSTMSLFFALLSLAAWAGSAAVLVLRFGLRGPQFDGLRRDVGQLALPLAFVVATVTTMGSLYYSEIANFIPCELCWYQRIAAYPLPVVLGTALVRRDPLGVRPYVIGPCLIGALVATYHSWIQAFPPESPTSFCTDEAPCTVKYVWEFGFISLPLMALSAFVTIIVLLGVAAPWRADREAPEPVDASTTLTEASS